MLIAIFVVLLAILAGVVYLCYKITIPVQEIPVPPTEEPDEEIALPPAKRDLQEPVSPYSLIEILDSNDNCIGRRKPNHRDITWAIETPGVSIRYPDGRIDRGRQ